MSKWKENRFPKVWWSDTDNSFLRATKYMLNLYNTDFQEGQNVRIVADKKQVVVVADKSGSKIIHKDSNAIINRAHIAGKYLLKSLNLEQLKNYRGYKGKIDKKDAWIFKIK